MCCYWGMVWNLLGNLNFHKYLGYAMPGDKTYTLEMYFKFGSKTVLSHNIKLLWKIS
jgi:hypothetical protein